MSHTPLGRAGRKKQKAEESNGGRTCFVISSCSSRGNVEKVSNLVPIRNGIAVCLIHHQSLRAPHVAVEGAATGTSGGGIRMMRRPVSRNKTSMYSGGERIRGAKEQYSPFVSLRPKNS